MSTVDEVQRSLISIQKMLENEHDPEQMNILNDLMSSILDIKSTQGLTNLTGSMKDTLSGGIKELQDTVSLKAFEYFKVHEFEPTKQIIPIMRTVVSACLEKGVL